MIGKLLFTNNNLYALKILSIGRQSPISDEELCSRDTDASGLPTFIVSVHP